MHSDYYLQGSWIWGRPSGGKTSNWGWKTSEPEAMWEWELEEKTSLLSEPSHLPTVLPSYFLPDNALIVSPSLSHLSLISPLARLLHLYFLAGFTNGLSPIEIAAHENFTFSLRKERVPLVGFIPLPLISLSLCILMFFGEGVKPSEGYLSWSEWAEASHFDRKMKAVQGNHSVAHKSGKIVIIPEPRSNVCSPLWNQNKKRRRWHCSYSQVSSSWTNNQNV